MATAKEQLTSWTQVPGVEGLVIRGSGQRYLPGARALYKVRRRDTTEAIVGAITGTVRRPQTLVLGRLDAAGSLRPVGRSALLRPDTARDLAERLTPAGPGHPWEGVRFTTSWGSRTPLDVVLVESDLVAEIMVDRAGARLVAASGARRPAPAGRRGHGCPALRRGRRARRQLTAPHFVAAATGAPIPAGAAP
uniref:Putative ATP dependent DNA ligase n=1 Tax=Streptomyces rochei TaxID=1928 RepID=F2Z8X2_STRRO|nr:putative ATP dependent DNA ligase [Streptomyces rochei]